MNERDGDVEEIPLDTIIEGGAPVTLPIVVGIGASAGGLQAFEAFFKELTPRAGMAYVVIQHLDPHHRSILPELLQRYTTIPVKLAENDLLVEPNTIYVIPENVMLGLFHGRFQLLGPTADMKIRLTIDYFFRSLALDVLDQAVAIVLSGTGSDGSLGLKAVKEAGGLVVAQDPTTTPFDGMPRSAIATGFVDFILRPEDMPQRLVDYWRLAPPRSQSSVVIPRQKPMSDALQQILLMIRTQTGHDFSQYKQSTIDRRVERLMAINHIEDLSDYVTFLMNNTMGIEALFRDVLIGVTNFFRDKEVFATLKETVIPRLFQNRQTDQTIRIWIPACSTGEEAYSMAILLQEQMSALKQYFRVQIFATDIDDQAVNTARLGTYPSNIEIDVPDSYLKQYFVATPEGYRVVKSLREMIVFAPHSVAKDPPFSKVDLISCRNLLIYLNANLQNRVLSYFHFALRPMGFLLLGTSESLGQHEKSFTALDSQHKIFQRTEGASPLRIKPQLRPLLTPLAPEEIPTRHPQLGTGLRAAMQAQLLAHRTPTAILINHQGHIRYVHGSSRQYLDVSGEFDKVDIIHAVRDSLRTALKTAISRAMIHQREVAELNIPLETETGTQVINIIVEPFAQSPTREALLVVYFEEVKGIVLGNGLTTGIQALAPEGFEQKHQLLQQELTDTRAYLQATIEELKSSNEEMQSINEELQSLNEELETSQEELKSVNEELMAINTELEGKIGELTWAHNDLGNTLNTLQTGLILLGDEFQVRRFNPTATQMFKLIPSDIGRSIGDIVSEFNYPTFLEDVQEVFNTLVVRERDVEARNGRWYALQIRPYRTTQNAIKGIVISFSDVTVRRKMEETHHHARIVAENIANMVSEPFLILDTHLTVINANEAFLETFQLTLDDISGNPLKTMGRGEWNIPPLLSLMRDVFEQNTVIQKYEVSHTFPDLGLKTLWVNVRPIASPDDQPLLLLMAIKDMTDHS